MNPNYSPCKIKFSSSNSSSVYMDVCLFASLSVRKDVDLSVYQSVCL